MNSITLTADQQNAADKFVSFLLDPEEAVFVLSGYSGTGKSTLVKYLIDMLPSILKTANLLQIKLDQYTVELTATTNKAAENLAHLTGMSVTTIHSALELTVSSNYRTGETSLVPRNHNQKQFTILFIDEASYIDSALLRLIFDKTYKCKIIFIGDPAQLTPVKSQGTPVFDVKFTGAQLSQVVRQAEGNPIVALSTKFRETVTSGKFFSFKPDGQAIKYLDRSEFNQAIETEFIRKDWKYRDSKILAWTNKCTIAYNHAVRDHVSGDPDFQVGDYAVCNKFVVASNGTNIKTDELVLITQITPNVYDHGVLGRYFTLDNKATFFAPVSLAAKKQALKEAKDNRRFDIVKDIDTHWIDLRAVFACTINKAQGSTFDKVFIDLDDIRRCNSGDQIARMLYVGVSRARHQVFLTGDLV